MFVGSLCVPGRIVVGFACKRVGFVQSCGSPVLPLPAGAMGAVDRRAVTPPTPVQGWDTQYEAAPRWFLYLCVTLGFTPAAYCFIRPPKWWLTL